MNTPLQAMRDLLEEDKRFKLEAYQFIRESLQFAHENLDLLRSESAAHETQVAEGDPPLPDPPLPDSQPGGQPAPKHVTGQQLCEACRRYAIEQYGYLAKMVLANWGIRSTGDFGDLVYNLIRIEQMRKSDTDRREDFDDAYCFDDAFEPQFEFASRDDD
jgi:uncharacterized repeat protein (TIGR04138 family)